MVVVLCDWQILRLFKQAGADLNLCREKKPHDSPVALLLRLSGSQEVATRSKRCGMVDGRHLVLQVLHALVELGGKWDHT